MKTLIGHTLKELEALVKSHNQPKFRAKQIAEWLYVHKVTEIEEMSNLPISFRQQLSENYTIGRHVPITTQRSKDGTEKYLFSVDTKKGLREIETVYIPESDRATLCISSQIGCKMNCSFCHTGKMGFLFNLSAAEIINQFLSCPHIEKLTNIVFMGMGEPLDNYDEVSKTLEILTAPWGLAWSPKRITVSTIGSRDGLLKLLQEQQCQVAISIHSPYPEERAALMPVEKAFPIEEVIATLQKFDFSGQRRLSFEYIVFDGLNDDLRHAEALIRILKPLLPDCRINLIKYHSIPGVDLRSPSPVRVQSFEDYLNSKGVRCTTRRSRGEDIFAACGMLATTKGKKPQ
ncbi:MULTISPECIES: 23S rRNA (adenine(2503)-C(2))-methyltransferase RlmN [Porphyromonas]|uniref:23S rRNA (adenine(2503)-C(2))-methyltransferase RlmN n=1 Tax=Porphyromonas TaxID=836 RepID=UPI00051D294E|nr:MULTISPECIES: 23S rRNA (adenine(2503)-C(2))-methyltransferase RlmN [Porphyromonas]KGL52948.1 ribosomal RNA large subunit methyltransferase N [Porphyromonas canoris]KGN70410.1 ribosomal RNA large subunit methyltransferase N [Porphyromonas sp. COT-108 OH1349]